MQFLKAFGTALMLCNLGFAVHASAQKPALAAMTLEQLDKQVAAARKELKGDPHAFCIIEPLLRELDRREPNSLTRAEAEYDAAICALSTNEFASFWQHIQAAEAVLPLHGGGNMRIAVESLALDIATGTHDPDRYIAHLTHVTQIDDPGVFAVVDGEKIYANLSQMPHNFRDKAYLAFAESSNFGNLPGYFRQAIAEFAVLPALQAGKRDVALRLIDEVSDPDHYYPLLIDRRYAALWPEIDKRVGLHQGRVATDFVSFSKAELAAEPKNRWAFGDVVRSLVVAGRNREAIAVYKLMPKDPQSIASYQPGDAWAINAVVAALDREGRRQEADEAFNLLASVSLEANPWMLTLLNHRTARLSDQGRWVDAMSAAKDSQAWAERYGIPFDQLTAATNMVCIAPHVPGGREVDRANALIVLNEIKFPLAAAIGALCRGDKVAAKAYTLAALKDEDNRGMVLSSLQPQGASKLPLKTMSAVPDLGEFVRSDPELTAEFNRYGRFLPVELQLTVSADEK